MNDVHSTVARKLRSAASALRADVEAGCTFELRDALLAEVAEIEQRADSIEEQVKPAVEEPKEFASAVRAGIDGLSDRVLWVRSASGYWFSETSRRASFSDLHHPEVLRVGLGAPSGEFEAGYWAAQADAHGKLDRLLNDAITSERKNAYEKAIQAVEELAP